jgi:hypothetical protein
LNTDRTGSGGYRRAGAALLNNDYLNRDLGNSSAPDVPHLFIASFMYELPVGKGRGLTINAPYPVELVFGGTSTPRQLQLGVHFAF